jgi:hypothetical protein
MPSRLRWKRFGAFFLLIVSVGLSGGCSGCNHHSTVPPSRTTIDNPAGLAFCLAFSRDGKTLAAGDDFTIRFWDFPIGK